MKIAVVDPSLFTWPYDRELVEGLVQNGHDVRLFGKALPAADPREKDPVLRQVFYRHLAPADSWPPTLKRVLKGLSHAGSLIRLRDELTVWAPDVIHFQWLPLPIIDCWFLPLLRRIAPLVLTVHDTMPFNGSPRSSIQAAGSFRAFRQFDHLIVHTDQGRRRLASVAAGGLSRVPHGLLHQDVAPAAAMAGSGGKRVTFLMFGQIKPYKGVDLLIDAAARLSPESRAQTRICVAGKPHMDMAPLRALAARLGVEPTVEFRLGFVPDGELQRLFAEADAFLFPYREIEASGALMTALAHAKPAIASRLGLFAELLKDGREALLVPPGDAAALAASLERIVGDRELRERLTRGAAALRATIPEWRDIAAQTVSVYEQAVRRWRSRAESPVRLRA